MRSAQFFRSHRRFIVGALFAVLTIAASILLARKLTTSSWPLAGVDPLLAAAAALAYLVSFVFRARAWHRLFPPERVPRPGRLPRLGRRRQRQRGRPALPPRLPGQDRRAAPARRDQGRARRDRALDRLARDDRRDRDAAALDLGDRDDQLDPARAAADRRRLRHRLLDALRRQRTAGARADVQPQPPPAHPRRARGAAHVLRRAPRRDRRVVLPLRLLVGARVRERRAAQRARALVLAARPRSP